MAAELGIASSTLRRWVAAHDARLEHSPAAPLNESADELDDEPVDEPVDEPADQHVTEAAGHSEPAASAEQPEPAAPAEPHDPEHIIAMLDSILEMFPAPGALPPEGELASPGPGERRDAEPPADRIPVHAGDDIFPTLPRLLPAYRFPLILLTLLAAVAVSGLVPPDYPLRPAVLALHVLSLVVSFGTVLVIDWHGLLWLSGRRGLTESTRLAAAAGPLIWLGLGGLIASGALLHPNLSSPVTLTKLVLVLAVAWNGAAMSEFRRRLAQLPPYVKPGDLPRRDWRLLLGATVISQIGWWGAILIGFVNTST